ncbi:MAG: M6 family metalloprotease domain-containing protein [Chitinophagaceae bacterium]|nr:M6 family metalloprotease domain-containing protein [Chitinophagaceae bacterium]
MEKIIIYISLFFFIERNLFAQIMYAPAFPDTIRETLLDGSNMKLFIKGDESDSHLETEDGYTIRKNRIGYYEYVIMDRQNKLILSGIRAKNVKKRTSKEKNFLKTIPKKIRDKNTSRSSSNIYNNAYNDTTSAIQYSASGTINNRFPTTGNRKILALLIRFKDLDSVYSRNSFDSLFNTPSYRNTGSFKDFFLQNSFQKLNVTTDVYGWYTADSSYRYYSTREYQLVVEAIYSAERAGVDFSQYDNDNDGYVESVMVVHSGPGREATGNSNHIWSHFSSGSLSSSYDGVTISNYAIQPEILLSQKTSIGVFCHEFGHMLGLPDLYDTDGSSQGLGAWCVMGNGNWLNTGQTPSSFSAYCKEKLGWVNPTLLSKQYSCTLKPSTDTNVVIRINTPYKNEYFLMENRQRRGFDSHLPGSGLAIYHINTDKTNNRDDSNRLVDLEEADALNDLDYLSRNILGIVIENKGDAGDLFPGIYSRRYFNDNTNPSSRTYNNKNTGISISQITVSTPNILFNYVVPDTTKPNITSIVPTGWPSSIIVSKRKGYNTEETNFSSDDSLYVDINFINNASTASSKTFINSLSINNQLLRRDTIKYSISPNQIIQYADVSIGKYNPGTYSLQFSLDVLDSLSEKYENDNVFIKEIIINPSHDEPCNAKELSIQKTYNPILSSNVNATASMHISNIFSPGCLQTSYNGGDVWFRFVIPASGTIDIITQEIQYMDGLMALYSGTCSNLSFIECFDDYDIGSVYNIMPRIYLSNQTPGDIFYIRFFSYHNNISAPFYIFAINKKSTVTIRTTPEYVGQIRGGGTYNDGDTVILSASASEGYTFSRWTENDSTLSSDSIFSFPIQKDRNITAQFTLKKYLISINTNIPNPGQIRGNGTYNYNDTITLRASSYHGYTFERWTENDSLLSYDTIFSFLIQKNRNITAAFILKQYIITTSLNIATAGKITGSGIYNYNQTVTLKAKPYLGYTFERWTENDSTLSYDTLFSFPIQKHRNIRAVFTPKFFTVFMIANDKNAGTISGAGTYSYNQQVTIKATPNENYTFLKWTENEQDISTNPLHQFSIFQNRTFKAYFQSIISHPLTNAIQNEGLTLFPNPTKEILTISIENNYIEEITIHVYSLTGNLLKTESFMKKKQKTIHTIPIQNLPKGKYIVKIYTNHTNRTQEFIKN